MASFFRKLRWLFERRRKEDHLAEELAFHLEEDSAERRDLGAAEQDARWAARRELGNLGRLGEETRAAWGWTTFAQFAQDLRYGARNIRRNPVFTLLAALSLALGIGANTAIYSFMDAVLARSLPVADPSSLVVLKWHAPALAHTDDSVLHLISGGIRDDPRGGLTGAIFPYLAFTALQRQTGAMSTLFAYRPARKLNMLLNGQAEIASGEYVSGGYFTGLGVAPAAGRLIAGFDDLAGAPGAVILSYAFAERRFGDAVRAVGQTALINNVGFTVAGVTPPGFFGVDPEKAPDVYLPLHAQTLTDPRPSGAADDRFLDPHFFAMEMMGRLRPGVTLAQAQTALSPVFGGWISGIATTEKERRHLPQLQLESGATGLDNLRHTYSQPLYVLLGMVALILTLACANIANLLLARATARRREMAIRLGIGAGRWRVIRQMLTESLMLASLGGAGGVLAGMFGIRFLAAALTSGDEPFPVHPELNLGVLAAAILLTAVTGLLFGIAPALQATRVDPIHALSEARGASASGARRGFSLGRILVVAQMAICLLLLVGAGLFVRTLSNLQSLDVGFARENVLLFKINAKQAGHRGPEMVRFYSDLERRFAGIPGVRAATMADSPLIGDGAWGWAVVPVGKPRPENAPTGHGSGASPDSTRVLGADANFFATMRIPLLAGRAFDNRDTPGAPLVAVVNEAWTKVNLDGANPVGRRVLSYDDGAGKKPQELEIVGLAKNARYDDLTGNFPAVVYLPVKQNPIIPVNEMTFYLRTAGDPTGYASAVREIVREADARVPVAGLTTQTGQIDREMAPESLFARLCSAFAALALIIACVGLYGTTSYAVARRTGEIGIRMALGASRSSVVWMILRGVLTLAGAGVAISLPLAYVASHAIQSLLFGVKPGDPAALAASAAILVAAAVTAGYIPARRASRIDPMAAVRHE